jgi:hypothetical protein
LVNLAVPISNSKELLKYIEVRTISTALAAII